MPLIILLPLLFLLLVLLIIWRTFNNQNKSIQQLNTQLEEQGLILTSIQGKEELNEQLITEQQDKIVELEKTILRNSHQYIKQFNDVNENITQLFNDVEQLNSQQPEDKLYSRAFKLAALGADIEEIAQTCEIPLAEAEMLLSIHQTKAK